MSSGGAFRRVPRVYPFYDWIATPRGPEVGFDLLLARSRPRCVVTFRNANATVPEKDRNSIERDTCKKQFDSEGVAEAVPIYEDQGRQIFQNPWQARDEYIRVILDRSPGNVCDFFHQAAGRKLSHEEKLRGLKLLELQRHAMLMYTSCGWFFDELSGLETVQTIQYAARAVQLAFQLTGNPNLESEFVERLARAKSNVPENQDGRQVYEKFVKPVMLDLKGVGAHIAVSSLFSDDGPARRAYCYTISPNDFHTLSSRKTKLVVGRAQISSDITAESENISFGVVHLGDHNITGGVREFAGEQDYQDTVAAITETFERGDLAELVRVVDKAYGSGTYTLKFLFRDEQRKIVR